jgi:Uma2 family endonuclease
MERMGNPALAPEEHFTYRHYRTWPDSERWELIEGRAWNMSPAPRRRHQEIVGKLYAEIRSFLQGKAYRVFVAPFDVLLPEGGEKDDDVDTVVQPDIVVYCDRSRLTRDGARGAPDFLVEILSPSTSKKDLNEKFSLYQRHQVREYWVVDPTGAWLCAYRLDSSGRFDEGELREPGRDYGPLASRALEGLTVDPAILFADLD